MTFSAHATTLSSPLAPYTFDALLDGAARMRPNMLALGDISETHALTFSQLERRVARLAAQLAATGLSAGDVALIVPTPEIVSLCALLAAARLGVHVVLAPLDISAPALALCIQTTRASIVLAPAQYGDASPIETAFKAAPLAHGLRLIAALSGPTPDGAVDLTPQSDAPPEAAPKYAGPPSQIVTLERQERALIPIVHQPATLVAAAMAFVARSGIGLTQPLISTLPPATFAGIACGPLAMLLSGATLHYNGPFDSAMLRLQLALSERAFLIAPAKAARHFADAGLLQRDGRLAALQLVSRWRPDGGDFAPPHPLGGETAIVDLHAFGERTLVSEPRDADGRPRAILEAAHEIAIGGESLVAIEAQTGGRDGIAFSGHAVTEPSER